MELIHGDADRTRCSAARTLAVQIEHELVHEMIRHCRRSGLDMSSAVAEAIAAYLDRVRSAAAHPA